MKWGEMRESHAQCVRVGSPAFVFLIAIHLIVSTLDSFYLERKVFQAGNALKQ